MVADSEGVFSSIIVIVRGLVDVDSEAAFVVAECLEYVDSDVVVFKGESEDLRSVVAVDEGDSVDIGSVADLVGVS